MAQLITKETHLGPRYAVAFEQHGKPYISRWTSFREEACMWGRIIRQHGYCMSAGRYPL
jgi:ribosomal protein L35AE/L33A